LAKQLDVLLCQRESVDQCLEAARLCETELMQLIQDIESLPEEIPLGQSTLVDPERLQQTLSELERFLVENNAQASRVAHEASEILKDFLGSQCETFNYQINLFNYDAALAILQACKKTD
jgi:hypothetical protein